MIAPGELHVVDEAAERLIVLVAHVLVDQALELLGHLGGRDVLGVEVRRRAQVAAERLGRVAGEDAAIEDERQLGPAGIVPDRPAELEPVDLRHAHVGDDGVDVQLLLEDRERGFPVRGRERLVAGAGEEGGEQATVGRRVVHEKDAHEPIITDRPDRPSI